MNAEEKAIELVKYRNLVIATLDYYILSRDFTILPDGSKYFEDLKHETQKHFEKGRLSRLKQWFHDLTESYIEVHDWALNKYLRETTHYDIDIFASFYQKIDKIIEKGKITTDRQFYDVNIMVDQLCQQPPVDDEKIKVLNRLLIMYEQKKGEKFSSS